MAPVTDTLSSTSDAVVAPVTDTLSSASDAVVAPVTDSLSPTSDLAVDVLPSASDGGSAVSVPASGGDAFGGPFTTSVDAGAGPVGDPGDAVISPFSSTVDSGADALGGGVDAVFAPFTSSIDVAAFSSPGIEDAAPFALSVLEPPAMTPSAGSFGTVDVDAVGVAASSVDGTSSLTDVMTQLAPDARLVASAAALALASEAIVGARLLGSHGDARMAFTNVRLVPCLVRSSIAQQVTAFTGSRVPATSMAGAGGGGGSVTTGDVGERSGSDRGGRAGVRGVVETITNPLREGFDQATRKATGEATDGFSDTRLMVQIGMALGVVYVAFLSVWFWATRVRWSSRA